jgi:hypothetical protein
MSLGGLGYIGTNHLPGRTFTDIRPPSPLIHRSEGDVVEMSRKEITQTTKYSCLWIRAADYIELFLYPLAPVKRRLTEITGLTLHQHYQLSCVPYLVTQRPL